jgi:hypothetical protein
MEKILSSGKSAHSFAQHRRAGSPPERVKRLSALEARGEINSEHQKRLLVFARAVEKGPTSESNRLLSARIGTRTVGRACRSPRT